MWSFENASSSHLWLQALWEGPFALRVNTKVFNMTYEGIVWTSALFSLLQPLFLLFPASQRSWPSLNVSGFFAVSGPLFPLPGKSFLLLLSSVCHDLTQPLISALFPTPFALSSFRSQPFLTLWLTPLPKSYLSLHSVLLFLGIYHHYLLYKRLFGYTVASSTRC